MVRLKNYLNENSDDRLSNRRYINYHKHTDYSNISSPDSSTNIFDYIARCVELGHTKISSVEHGVAYNWVNVLISCKETYSVIKSINKLSEKNKLFFEDEKTMEKLLKDFKSCKQLVKAYVKNYAKNIPLLPVEFIYGVEGYFVPDIGVEDDSRNFHIIIMARNKKGIKEINMATSMANIEGFYYKPRMDFNMLRKLNPNNVLVTTACLGGIFKDDKYEEYLVELHKIFGDSLYLEIQAHHTKKQYDCNVKILDMHKKYNIPLIVGTDSHAINSKGEEDRTEFLLSKGIRYDDEDGWFMDFPDYEELHGRFMVQELFTDEQISNAIDATNVMDDFDIIELDFSIKLPTIYPNMTQEERDNELKKLVTERWLEYDKTLPAPINRDIYIKEIRKEMKIITDTKMTDYFLLNYYVIKIGKEKYGGVLTYTGRGSGASFLINMLLGFTTIDRLRTDIPLLAERFMSTERILETKSLPDIDHNTANPIPFQLAQQELLGEHGSYWMCAWGKFKEKSAFKMYAKANDIDFDTSNNVIKQLEAYEKDLKYEEEHKTSDDDEVFINIEDYVDRKYLDILDDSSIYIGIVDSVSQSPCSFLLFNGDIREEFGVFRVKNDAIIANIDGNTSDMLKYLKNDILTVATVDITAKVFDLVGIPQPTAAELVEICEDDDEVWEIYSEGITLEVNQLAQASTRMKVVKYVPMNINELTMLIAGIRPSFKSMVDVFLNRRKFTYGIPTFDKLLQGKHSSDSFLMFQEQIQESMGYTGIPLGQTMSVIKAISKKKTDVIMSYKDTFVNGFVEKLLHIDDSHTKESANEVSLKVWQIIEDASAYGFNASHALAVALDSLYNAYCKAKYPYEFYKVVLTRYAEKGDKDKVAELKKEMKNYFNIGIGDIKYGVDNREFIIDKENKCINQSLLGVKFIGKDVVQKLYYIGCEIKYRPKTFSELYDVLKENGIDSRQISILVKINYFKDFGGINKLLRICTLKSDILKNKTYNKVEDESKKIDTFLLGHIKNNSKETASKYTILDKQKLFSDIENELEDTEISFLELARYEFEFTKNIISEIPSDCIGVLNVEVASRSGWVKGISFRDGKEFWFLKNIGIMPEKGEVIMLTDVDMVKHKNRNVYRIKEFERIGLVKKKK